MFCICPETDDVLVGFSLSGTRDLSHVHSVGIASKEPNLKTSGFTQKGVKSSSCPPFWRRMPRGCSCTLISCLSSFRTLFLFPTILIVGESIVYCTGFWCTELSQYLRKSFEVLELDLFSLQWVLTLAIPGVFLKHCILFCLSAYLIYTSLASFPSNLACRYINHGILDVHYSDVPFITILMADTWRIRLLAWIYCLEKKTGTMSASLR